MTMSSRWTTDRQNPDDPIYAVLMISRNKDNKDKVEGFVQRKASFLYHMSHPLYYSETLAKRFSRFVDEGKDGEVSRMYVSVNSRDPIKIKRELCHLLIDDNLPSNTPLTHMESVVTSISMKKGFNIEKKWLFDFDIRDTELENRFFCDVKKIVDADDYDPSEPSVEQYRTPRGSAFIVKHGFDIRKLPKEWKDYIHSGDITLMRDDMLCVRWATKA